MAETDDAQPLGPELAKDGRWTMDDGRRPSVILAPTVHQSQTQAPSSIVHGPPSAARQSSIVHRLSSAARQSPILLTSLGFSLGVIVAIVLGLAVSPPLLHRDMRVKQEVPALLYRGDNFTNPPDYAYGLYDPEMKQGGGEALTWTNGHATVPFPYAAYYGSRAEVSVRIAGMREPGQPPPTVTLGLNGRDLSRLALEGASFQTFNLVLDTQQAPSPYLHPADVHLDIASSTISGPDGKQRGIAVDWVELRPARPLADIVSEALVWGLLLAITLFVARSRMSARWSVFYGAAALCTLVLAHFTYVARAISPTIESGLVGLVWVWAAALAPRRALAWGALLAAGGLWVVLGGRMLIDWELDDAYISYRYALNFVQGHGLVYNPGEPVEGYTNFLWTVFIAAGMPLGLHPASTALAGTIASGLCLLALTYYLGTRLAGAGSPWAWLAVGLLAVDAGFITYGPKGGGLETMTFALFALLAVDLLWGIEGRSKVLLRVLGGLALALAALTRPEGLMVAALLLAARAWQDRRLPAGRGYGWRAGLAASLLPFLAIIVPYQAWRLSFYGYPFPNSFYDKTGTTLEQPVRGLEYAWSFASDHWLVVALVLAGLAMAALQFATNRKVVQTDPPTRSLGGSGIETAGSDLRAVLALLVVVFTLYIVSVGGDWATAGRFFVPIAAPLALLAQDIGRWTMDDRRWTMRRALSLPPSSIVHRPSSAARRASAASLVVLVAAYFAYALWLQRPDGALAVRTLKETNKLQKWSLAGLWIRDNTPPDTVLAASPAGGLPFYSRRYVIDMFGLNDLHIAHLDVKDMGARQAGHEKSDPAYVLDRKPDYMLRYEHWYFHPMTDRLDREYEIKIIRTPTGYETVLLHRIQSR